MIELVGSQYSYQGERLSQPQIIIVRDHHYDEKLQCFPVEKLLRLSLCDPQDHVVIFDHVLQHDDVLQPYNLVYFPSFLARENCEFVSQKIQSDWTHKSVVFNFMINKPRPHRTILLKLIEQLGLTSYCHSLAWQHNHVNQIPVTDYRFGSETVLEYGVKNGSFKNAHTYQRLLQKKVFEPSFISLVTEPCFYERETIVTEKTFMAMYGGTVPIWTGGWRIASYLKNIGFDIFEDVIDHSYQTLSNPTDRTEQAVLRNLHLLKDFTAMQKFFIDNQNRFQHNVNLLESNIFTCLCQQQIDHYSGELHLHLKRLLG